MAVQYTFVEGNTWETVAREFGIKAEILRTFNQSVTLKAGSTIDLRGRDVPQLGAGGSLTSNPDGTATLHRQGRGHSLRNYQQVRRS